MSGYATLTRPTRLSDSTQRNDRTEKLLAYQRLNVYKSMLCCLKTHLTWKSTAAEVDGNVKVSVKNRVLLWNRLI